MFKYVIGDATRPQTDGKKIIVHIVNSLGGWGSGFVVALSRRWKKPEQEYRRWHKSGIRFNLGEIQVVKTDDCEIVVVNMMAQEGYGEPGKPPIRYDALRTCLEKVAKGMSKLNDCNIVASIHMPRIGCGLAGGSWDEVEKIIQETLGDYQVYVYDLPGSIVQCSMCGSNTDVDTAHLHQDKYIGECCWDERLKITE